MAVRHPRQAQEVEVGYVFLGQITWAHKTSHALEPKLRLIQHPALDEPQELVRVGIALRDTIEVLGNYNLLNKK